MRLQNRYMRWVAMALCVALVVQLSGCGTLIHPDRRGQDGGRIDPAIAILDGVGLLLFVIPGLIAYAIDFSTGAIYLPGTDSAAAPDDEPDRTNQKVVYVDPDSLDEKTIARVVQRETGISVDIEKDQVEAYRYEQRQQMVLEMAKVNRQLNDRQAFALALN